MSGSGSKNIGIDLGIASMPAYMEGRGIVLCEPLVATKSIRTGEVISVSPEAKEMIGRIPDTIKAVRPIKDGVIADYDTIVAMPKRFMERMVGNFKPAAMICVSSGATKIEKRAVINVARVAGVREVHVTEEPSAATIGAELPVMDPTAVSYTYL